MAAEIVLGQGVIIFVAMEIQSFEDWLNKTASVDQACRMCMGGKQIPHSPMYDLENLLTHLDQYHKGVTGQDYYKYLDLTRQN
jgi:hypothetical protein